MSVEWATLIVSVVVILTTGLANAVGAALNSRRYAALEIAIERLRLASEQNMAKLRERVAVIEATHRVCPVARHALENGEMQ